MNVCLISREYPPFFGGGIGTYTEMFSRALAERAHGALVVTVSDDGREQREEGDGVTVVRLPFIKGDDWSGPHPAIATPDARAAFQAFSPVSVFAMQVARALPRLVEEFSIEVVEAPDTGALAWFALNARRTGRAWSDGHGPAFVTVVHSPTAWIEHWNRAAGIDRRTAALIRMEAESAAWSDGLVCPSTPVARWAEGHWGLSEGAIEVIPNPLGGFESTARAACVGPGSPRSAPESPGPRRIVYAGRLEPRKGVDTLLEGLVLAVRGGADLALDLVGRDTTDAKGRPYGASLVASLVPSGLRGRVRLHGQVTREALNALRVAAAAAAVPSPMDNFPYTCVEAMSAGCPVIAARAGGMAEMVRDGLDGMLFEPGDAPSCAGALGRAGAMTGEELTSLGRSAAARIVDLCANERIVAARLDHYRRALAARARNPRGREAPVVVVNAGGASKDALAALVGAVRAGPVFAHGWVRDGDRAIVYGTPSAYSLASGPPVLGPVAVRADALHDLVVTEVVSFPSAPGAGGDAHASTTSTHDLIVALVRERHKGAVVPEVLVEAGAGSLEARVAPGARLRRVVRGVLGALRARE